MSDSDEHITINLVMYFNETEVGQAYISQLTLHMSENSDPFFNSVMCELKGQKRHIYLCVKVINHRPQVRF